MYIQGTTLSGVLGRLTMEVLQRVSRQGRERKEAQAKERSCAKALHGNLKETKTTW